MSSTTRSEDASCVIGEVARVPWLRVAVIVDNANGSEKLPLLFIGKSATPRWFKNKSEAVQYTSTKKAWMTTTVFQSWLRDLDASMREQGRQILLLVDNASSHSDEDVTLTNIRLEKLPPNTTSKLQPLDQGIIHCVKRHVLTRKMQHALDEMDTGNDKPYKVGMFKGIEWSIEAWQSLPAETIQHCWLHSGLISKSDMMFVLH